MSKFLLNLYRRLFGWKCPNGTRITYKQIMASEAASEAAGITSRYGYDVRPITRSI